MAFILGLRYNVRNRKAYWCRLRSLLLITESRFSQRTPSQRPMISGSAYGDMFSRPVIYSDRREEAMDMLLYIYDQYYYE